MRASGDGLEGAGLVVGCHDGDQHGVGGERGGQGVGGDDAVVVDGQVGHVHAVQAFQGAAGLQDGGVFGDLGDNVRARAGATAGVAGREDGAADGEVVGFGAGAGAGEHDLGGVGADQADDLGAGAGQRALRFRAVGVAAGGVAEVLGQVWQRSLGNAGVDRGGGVVVQVDRPVGQGRERNRLRRFPARASTTGGVVGHAVVPVVTGRSARRHSSMPSRRRTALRPRPVSRRTAS